MTYKNPICVALDTPDIARALELAKLLHGHVGLLKIGMEFFYAHGAKGYEGLGAAGIPIFLDMKLHDIPNTVAQGLRSLLKLAPAPAITNAVGVETKLIAVTILTSLSNEDLWAAGFARDQKTDDQALRLAELTHQAGLDGVVCSPLDLQNIRTKLPRKFLTVVPGIRPTESSAHDQKRVATPKSAVDAGADVLVIGRAITGAADPAAAAQAILESLR
jgi:orotidine-5'-phosphate decarboxylase